MSNVKKINQVRFEDQNSDLPRSETRVRNQDKEIRQKRKRDLVSAKNRMTTNYHNQEKRHRVEIDKMISNTYVEDEVGKAGSYELEKV